MSQANSPHLQLKLIDDTSLHSLRCDQRCAARHWILEYIPSCDTKFCKQTSWLWPIFFDSQAIRQTLVCSCRNAGSFLNSIGCYVQGATRSPQIILTNFRAEIGRWIHPHCQPGIGAFKWSNDIDPLSFPVNNAWIKEAPHLFGKKIWQGSSRYIEMSQKFW